jgi:hypothetical protein
MVLKDQGTSLTIHPKVSVLTGKPLVLLKILKTSQPTVILFSKKPISNFSKTLNWRLYQNQRTTTPITLAWTMDSRE